MTRNPSATAVARLEELLELYAGDELCLAAALCDEHPAGDLALTIVEADLSARQVTFGELREGSERCAAGLAELGVLRPPAVASDALVAELQQCVKIGFPAHAYLRAVHVVHSRPRTSSGKVQRFLLRERRRSEVSERLRRAEL